MDKNIEDNNEPITINDFVINLALEHLGYVPLSTYWYLYLDERELELKIAKALMK